MIKIDLTVREAVDLAIYCPAEMREKIVAALESALGSKEQYHVTITGGMTTNNRIPCIKAVRQHTEWGLKEAKDWTDDLVGRYDSDWGYRSGGRTITTTLKTPEAAENLLRDLTTLGCEGYLS